MSSLERNKGTLKFIAKGEEATALFPEVFQDEQYFMSITGNLYKIIYEVEGEVDSLEFTEIIGDIHGSQDLEFHTIHHNGIASFQEMLDEAIIEIASE